MWGIIGTWYFTMKGVEQCAPLLKDGMSAMDAVVQSILLVENDPEVDTVGYGGIPNRKGAVELDAALMNGETLAVGAVAGLRHYKNPILVARDVLLNCTHNMLIGEGAEEFAASQGHLKAELLTAAAQARWAEEIAKNNTEPMGHDTVGMVALDGAGSLFAGVSTSGLGMKMPGRVGDSPLIGSGFYADADWGGATATGWGEDIMKGCASYAAVQLMRSGCTPQEAAERTVKQLHMRLARHDANPGNIALVCMDKEGRFGGAANHEGFQYAAASHAQAPRLYDVKSLQLKKPSGK